MCFLSNLGSIRLRDVEVPEQAACGSESRRPHPDKQAHRCDDADGLVCFLLKIQRLFGHIAAADGVVARLDSAEVFCPT